MLSETYYAQNYAGIIGLGLSAIKTYKILYVWQIWIQNAIRYCIWLIADIGQVC